jgi:hypothetical protein
MTTRFWWIVMAVLMGALIAAGVLSRVYVGQHIPAPEAERLVPPER